MKQLSRLVILFNISILFVSCSPYKEFSETEFQSLETIDVSNNVILQTEDISQVEETIGIAHRREPDIDLPAVSGFEQDEYGNYVITEEMFNGSRLPLDSNGLIPYVYYYDSNDNVLNPMPEYYENYQQYFNLIGG